MEYKFDYLALSDAFRNYLKIEGLEIAEAASMANVPDMEIKDAFYGYRAHSIRVESLIRLCNLMDISPCAFFSEK